MNFAWAVALLHSLVTATHIPLRDQVQATFHTGTESTAPDKQWNFAEGPGLNTTSHLIFDTVNSLLQHWPNTRYRNGHTLVPGTIPRGTLLYHGTWRNEMPTAPDWVATDPEHSYLFARSWFLTLVVTRPLKVLYFDGSSAAKIQGGAMDSQDLLTWGEVKPEWTFKERERIDGLCEWGKKYDVDGYDGNGFVSENATKKISRITSSIYSEIMLCDFTAGVKTVSFLDLNTRDQLPPMPSPPPTQPLPQSLLQSGIDKQAHVINRAKGGRPSAYRVIEAGHWHNRFPGETRVKLDYSGLISFYDSELFPDLQAQRQKAAEEGKDRWDHRLEHTQKHEVDALRRRLDEVLVDDANPWTESGIDWQTLFQVVHDRYAERLEVLLYLLNSTSTSGSTTREDVDERLRQAHRHMISMVAPYIIRSAVPSASASAHANHTWALPILELCATTHTQHLVDDEVFSSLTRSEKLLLEAVQDVSKEICRVLVQSWAEGVEAGFPATGDSETLDSQLGSASGLEDLRVHWYSNVDSLMKWLDWSYWIRCRPACGYEETCYLPMWPFFGRPRGTPPDRGPAPGPEQSRFLRWKWDLDMGEKRLGMSFEEDDDDDWIRPKPKCVRRVEPFGFR